MRKMILNKRGVLLKLASRAARWHLKYYLGGDFFPIACGMYVSNICNFKCRMCNIWRNGDKSTIPIEQFKSIVDDLCELGVFYFSLSGGEPFLVGDIFERITYAKSRLPFVHVVTNGSLIDQAAARELERTGLDELSISIDGPREFHDELRGFNGAHRHALQAIENMRQYAPGVKLGINTIITPQSVKGLSEILELAREKDICIKFQPVNQHPVFLNQGTTSDRFSCEPRELEEIKNFVAMARKEKRVLNSDYFLSLIPRFFSGERTGGMFTAKCLFPYHHLEIKEDGALYPCLTGMDWKGGFPIDRSLKALIHSGEYRSQQKKLESCNLCRDNMYICYFETRITFPLHNYIRYNLMRRE